MSLAIDPRFESQVRRDEPLSRHTSWHVGGPADVWFEPTDRQQLLDFLRSLPDGTPLLWIGLGSNLLVRDGGIRGVVVSTRSALGTIEQRGDCDVYVEAGVPCARIARQCERWDLGPAGWFAGIPGTLGGALAMNAGAFGGDTWQHVVCVETLDELGGVHSREPEAFRVGYRHVEPLDAARSGERFLSATLRFAARSDAGAMRELLERRRQTQPIGEWSCGSVFTNPPGDHAARLIESAGLKGCRIGGAEVSRKHANFILNTGDATARDIEQLMAHVQREVARTQGCTLTPEVRIVGEAA